MDFSKVEDYMNLQLNYGFPFLDLAVTHRGKTVYRKGVGFSDAGKTRPIDGSEIFWVFSISKVSTCVAAMRLIQDGILDLDAPVADYLPEYRDLTVTPSDGSPAYPAKNVLTVRHLMSMTGGYGYEVSPMSAYSLAHPDAGTVGLMRALPSLLPLRSEPGTRYRYSLCHDILGAVIEVAAGEKFGEYLKKTVFDPLGMTKTGFHPSEESVPELSGMFRFRHGAMTCEPVENVNDFRLKSDLYESGGAGLYSCVDDQIRLAACLAGGGRAPNGEQILLPSTIERMGKNELPDSALPDFGKTRLYGYGWGLCGRAHRDPLLSGSRSAVGEFGWDGAAGSFLLADPVNEIALFLGTAVRSCDYAYHAVHPTLRNLVYDAILNG